MADGDFVKVINGQFYLQNKPFRFLGANATYLFQQKAYGNNFIVDEVFHDLKRIGIKVVRISAHYEADEIVNSAVIMSSPGKYNETALRSLDYVLFKAREYDMKLILVLSNNWKDYGGIPQYLKWAKQFGISQSNLYHNDFFTHSTIKEWFKNYLQFLIERVNTFNSIKYKDDDTIFSWELINEPRTADKTGNIILNWADEISKFIRTIDANHLIGIGEEGFDVKPNNYSNVFYCYNNRGELFDGSNGVSFEHNTSLTGIHYGNIHLYPESWGFSELASMNWINDHSKISKRLNKPLLVGEFGFKSKSNKSFEKLMKILKKNENSNGVFWQYLHPSINYNDCYGINWNSDFEICSLYKNFCDELEKDTHENTKHYNLNLRQNYPNPFNSTTTIQFEIPSEGSVQLYITDIMGKVKKILYDEVMQQGSYETILSVDQSEFSSGIYFYTLVFNNERITKKMVYIK
ncbi:MAG: cellulase family glycosylhydrolase [Ignavibacteria bacterium]|nr:cellulase family glycosylhydrolase [Ignavibacteria bacterium]